MFYQKNLWKTLTVAAIVACTMLIGVAPAQACNSGGGGVIIVPHFPPPLFWIIFTGFSMKSAAGGTTSDMDACFTAISANGLIDTVHSVELVDSTTGRPFPGFNFVPEEQITNTLVPLTGDGDWRGFFTTVTEPPEQGAVAEFHFEVSLIEGATTKDLVGAFKNGGLLASGSADLDQRRADFHHFSVQQPSEVINANEESLSPVGLGE